jgi:hypothetical protein
LLRLLRKPLHEAHNLLMMEAARTTETSVDIQLRTWHYIPEDSELHTRRRENLKSHKPRHVLLIVFFPQSKRQTSIQPFLWLLRVLRKPRYVLLSFIPNPNDRPPYSICGCYVF